MRHRRCMAPLSKRITTACHEAPDKVNECEEMPLLEEVYIEDFVEQLQLWTDNPMGLNSEANAVPIGGVQQSVQQVVAPAREAISALKAELTTLPMSNPSEIISTKENCERR